MHHSCAKKTPLQKEILSSLLNRPTALLARLKEKIIYEISTWELWVKVLVHDKPL